MLESSSGSSEKLLAFQTCAKQFLPWQLTEGKSETKHVGNEALSGYNIKEDEGTALVNSQQ